MTVQAVSTALVWDGKPLKRFALVSSEGYIPPEGPGTPSADCYSPGKLLYELSTGHDRGAWPEPPDDLATRPDHERLLELNAILHRAGAPESRLRYQSVSVRLDFAAPARFVVANRH